LYPLLAVVLWAAACAQKPNTTAEQTAKTTAGPTAAATATASPPASAKGTTKPAPDGATPDGGALDGAAPAAEQPPAGMVKIPAGIFLMGSLTGRGNTEEMPAHEAIVASFFLDKTEVTQEAFLKCSDAGACKRPSNEHRFCNLRFEGREKHPVNCIDLHQATAYCKFVGKRVPTEREWEYAASGGSERRPFSWGSEPANRRNACYEHPFGSCVVGQYPPGAFGLYDMSGNVWEWTATRFRPYPSSGLADAIDPNRHYVYRGGSWSRRFPKWLKNTLRNRYKPHKWSGSLGVRCAKTIKPLECPKQTAAREGECVRTTGNPLCEEGFAWNGKKCAPSRGAPASAPGATSWASDDPAVTGVPKHGDGVKKVGASYSRSRTPQHDKDCKRHWPKTPAAYLFKGGRFWDRKKIITSAGCRQRDMGTSWSSACCPG